MKIARESKMMTVEEVQQYLTFQLADEEYAISILKVKEILEYDTITTVPNTPKWINGVLNLRGSVVPVVDLAVKFGRPASPITKLSCIVITEIVCDGEKITMGVLTDEVSQVVDLGPGDIEQPPPFGTRMKTDYLNGMGRSGKKFCLILNIDKVLSGDELLEITDSFEDNAAGTLSGANSIIAEASTSMAAGK